MEEIEEPTPREVILASDDTDDEVMCRFCGRVCVCENYQYNESNG